MIEAPSVTTVDGVVVHEVTPDRPDLLDALVAVRVLVDEEQNPGDPPVTAAELGPNLFQQRSDRRTRAWIGVLDGRPAGQMIVTLDDGEDNAHLAQDEGLDVVPTLRRRGVATALLRTVLPILARDEARTSLLLFTNGRAGESFVGRLGLEARTEERCSRLRVDEVDEDALEAWLAEGATRTDGYRLVSSVGPVPQDQLASYLQAAAAMEDVPLDDLDYVVTPLSEDKVRSREAARAARGERIVRTVALAPDGSGAGMTELMLSAHRPALGWQGDTGVVAAHRGHGLGRWLKATNHRLALAEEPRLAVIETWNAQSNRWMLDVNVAMGFRPHQVWTGHQGDLGAAIDALG